MNYTIDDIKKSPYCTKQSNTPIVVKENKKKFTINNPQKKDIYKCEVDGGLIRSELNKKCDFLTIITEKEKDIIYYIELKGKNYKVAFEQILSTDSMINQEDKRNIVKEAFIITSRAPKATSDYVSAYAKACISFKKKKIKLHPLKNMSGETTA